MRPQRRRMRPARRQEKSTLDQQALAQRADRSRKLDEKDLWGEPTDWRVPSREDQDRLMRLLRRGKGARTVGPAILHREWCRLAEARKRYVVLRGVAGALADLCYDNVKRREVLDWYRRAGWYGVIFFLVRTTAPHKSIMDAEMFNRWGFVPDRCEYREVSHWYFRPTVGRRPEACRLHARAARQARYRTTHPQQSSKLRRRRTVGLRREVT